MKKWIQKAIQQKGALHRALRINPAKTIPTAKLEGIVNAMSKKEQKGKLSAGERKLLRRVNLAKTLKNLHREKK